MLVKTNNFLEQYYEDCKSGKEVIGHELMLQLEKLMEEMNYDEYIYDTTDADIRIHFIENVIKLTKSPFYGKPMKLMLFQKAFITALYSFKMLDGTRRFQRAIFLLARKNGKSELCSALILTEMILGGKGMDICAASNNDTQSDILVSAVDTMRIMLDPKSKCTWRNQKGIKCLINDNKLFKLSSRVKNKEGRNIDFSVIDESNEMSMDDAEIVKAIEQSQSLKENPLLILITTEGFLPDGFLSNELKRARGILDDEIKDSASERYLIWLYTQDSENEIWQGNKENGLWKKSNPTLGTVKKWGYLEQQVALARTSKTDRAFVLTKDFNVVQNSATQWLKTEDFSYEYEPFDLEDFRGSLCLGAVDIAETTDLTSAKIILTKPNNKKKYIHSMYWIPEGKLERGNDDKNANAKYTEWAKKGLLRICDGNYLNTTVVADWFLELYKKYGLRVYKVGYDSKFSNEFINRMDDYGFETEIIWQRPAVLTRGINMSEVDLQAQNVIGLNEIDKWCLSNATLKTDSQGFSILEKIKGQHSRKIDGAVTLVMAYEMFARYRQVLEQNN